MQQPEKVALGDADLAACPGENTLLALVEGGLDGGARGDVGAHLRGCAECQEIFSEITRPTPFGIGRRCGRYIVKRLIGAGGMGLVYEAFDPLLSRPAALKLIRTDLDTGGGPAALVDLRSRLLREATALARFNHPNVVSVYDVGETDDSLLYIAMEFVDGTTLARWLPRQPRTWKEVFDVYLKAGRGLAAAHDAGVVHRDFKPSNVLVAADDARVLITDFGLARMTPTLDREDAALADTARAAVGVDAVTRAGALLGSPADMSPEQLAGKHADLRSDVFRFCVALWAGLYGTRPFGGATIDELRSAIATRTMTAPLHGSDVPARIREMLERGLHEQPDERPRDMHVLIDELERRSAHEGLSRAERILREADALFHPTEKSIAVPAVAVSLLEGAVGERLRPQARTSRPDLPDLSALEVSGRTMRRLMELLGPYDSVLSHFMVQAGLPGDADGIVRFDADAWYPYPLALDFARSDVFGPELAHRIGQTYARAVLDTQEIPPGQPFTIECLALMIDSFDRTLRLRGVTLDRIRAAGNASGDRTYIEHDPATFEIRTRGAARCATSRGFFAGVAAHFAEKVDLEHSAGLCRDEGANECGYMLRARR
jgi:serine/threonine protein kinase